jgi:hypothetical protein
LDQLSNYPHHPFPLSSRDSFPSALSTLGTGINAKENGEFFSCLEQFWTPFSGYHAYPFPDAALNAVHPL